MSDVMNDPSGSGGSGRSGDAGPSGGSGMSGSGGLSLRARASVTFAAAVLLAVVVVVYILRAPTGSPGIAEPSAAGTISADGPRLRMLDNGMVAAVSLGDPSGPRIVTSQRCDRAYAAAGTVACLRPASALGATRLSVLDDGMRERRSIRLTGFPNRLRVSDSGRMIAWTLFVSGDSYAGGEFSTRAGILDTRTGRLASSVEEFAAVVDGRPYRAADVNVWGITFSHDDNRFYATMATAGHRYLVEGDFAAKTLKTLADGVECPSLSPDGTRVAFKAAVGGDPARGWRLSVLDLASRKVVATAENRSVDDQAIWLDERTVAYGLQRGDGVNDVWAVPADASGSPRLLVPGANSPSIDLPGA
ncbi:TolB-like translocation protein; signal peptide [Planotetraspora silvatica]|uniref:TolB-like translocation protein signal peptide n=1 Tax=Planotetraspora silvatica TaxID=234614 RepID=A0A8J3UP07_9ACTN|nr:hypothetical protein [Planotetraspora silvatica]GII47861.1 TolB-like translocation protein; signal peptide [Planotetraspora silvatica]